MHLISIHKIELKLLRFDIELVRPMSYQRITEKRPSLLLRE